MYRRFAASVALAVVVAACGTADEPRQFAATTTSAVTTSSTSSSTTEAPTTTGAVPAEPAPPTPIDPCELLDAAALAAAGFPLDPNPAAVSVTADEDPSVAEQLGRDELLGFASCDASPVVRLVVWEAESEEAAAAHLQLTLSSAERDGSTERRELPDTLTVEGASVIDVEFDNSTVQWRVDRYHIVINVLSFADAGLTPQAVVELHDRLVTHATTQLR